MIARCIIFFILFNPIVAITSRSWNHYSHRVPFKQLKLSELQHGTSPKEKKTYAPVISHEMMNPRGGGSAMNAVASVPYAKIFKTTFSVITFAGKLCLPPIVRTVRIITSFYRTLPMDGLIAQIGLVYCFCGGSYPTLFAAIQAARISGLQDVQKAVSDLVDEAMIAVDAAKEEIKDTAKSARDIFSKTTTVVMKNIDPVKINRACLSLYTAWLGVSIVLEKEFAKTINHAITLGEYFEIIIDKLLAPPVYLVVPKGYHRWVPVGLGWISKGIAIRLAWRLQRILTTCTSAVVGGLMFSRAVMRMLLKERNRTKASKKDVDTTLLDEALGYAAAAVGVYVQLGDCRFDPKVKFPLNLVTWPFDIVENWIQWQISE